MNAKQSLIERQRDRRAFAEAFEVMARRRHR